MNFLVSLLILLSITVISIQALKCAQCEGTHGFHPKNEDSPSTCDNRNNHCQTDQFCVKIIDPMAPAVRYTTFRADCWFQNTLSLTPSNQTFVSNQMCYTMIDGSVPAKTFTYCFCNDVDYCNSSSLDKSLYHILFFYVLLIIR